MKQYITIDSIKVCLQNGFHFSKLCYEMLSMLSSGYLLLILIVFVLFNQKNDDYDRSISSDSIALRIDYSEFFHLQYKDPFSNYQKRDLTVWVEHSKYFHYIQDERKLTKDLLKTNNIGIHSCYSSSEIASFFSSFKSHLLKPQYPIQY